MCYSTPTVARKPVRLLWASSLYYETVRVEVSKLITSSSTYMNTGVWYDSRVCRTKSHITRFLVSPIPLPLRACTVLLSYSWYPCNGIRIAKCEKGESWSKDLCRYVATWLVAMWGCGERFCFMWVLHVGIVMWGGQMRLAQMLTSSGAPPLLRGSMTRTR